MPPGFKSRSCTCALVICLSFFFPSLPFVFPYNPCLTVLLCLFPCPVMCNLLRKEPRLYGDTYVLLIVWFLCVLTIRLRLRSEKSCKWLIKANFLALAHPISFEKGGELSSEQRCRCCASSCGKASRVSNSLALGQPSFFKILQGIVAPWNSVLSQWFPSFLPVQVSQDPPQVA